jgi:hypothetical protein
MCDCYDPPTPLTWNLGDGRVKFQGTAPETEGYVVDANDLSILVPSMPVCRAAVLGITGDKLLTVCNQVGCDHQYQQVTPSICASCPLFERFYDAQTPP